MHPFLADVVAPQQSPAYRLGQLVCTIGPLLGAIFSGIALRRRETNVKAISGLMIVLFAWFATGLCSLILRPDPKSAASPEFVNGLKVTLTTVALILMCGGGVLALVGVIESHQYPQRYRRGRKRGYLALVFVVAIAGYFIVSGLASLQKWGDERRAKGTTTEIAPAGSTPAPAPTAHGPTVTVEEHNYKITAPEGWTSIEPRRVSQLATAVFKRNGEEVFTSIIAEHELAENPLTPEKIAESVKENMRTKGRPTFLSESTIYAGGLKGIRVETMQQVGTQNTFFVHWVTAAGGEVFQVMSWGYPRSRFDITAANARFAEGLKLLDPTRLADGVQPVERYVSKDFGWSIELKGSEWHQRWKGLSADAPAAEWGVTTEKGAAFFCVVPVWIDRDEADIEALTHALASRIGLNYPDPNVFGVKEWSDKTQTFARGQSFAWEGQRNGLELLFRSRVVRLDRRSFLLAAWYDKAGENRMELLDEALDRVKFERTAPRQPDEKFWTPRDFTNQRLVFNSLGVFYERAQRLDEAERWFKRAYALESNDATVLLNYANTISGQGRAHEALAFLQQELPKFRTSYKVIFGLADLQMSTGDTDGGLRRYAEAFENGYRDDSVFANFARLAVQYHRQDLAHAALDKYAHGSETPRLRKLRASLLQSEGKYPEALAILQGLVEKTNDAETLQALADCQFAAKQYEESLATCQKLLDAGRDTATVYRTRGYAEFSLKRYRESKESFEIAAKKDPVDPESKRMLEYLAGMLGQGAHQSVKTPIAAVPLPEGLPEPPAIERKDAYLRDYSACYRRVLRSVAFDPGRELRTTDRQTITVFDHEGVQSFNSLRIPFDPLGEEVYVNELVVKDGAGKVVAKSTVEDTYVVDDGVDDMATQRKILHIPVPALQPGFTIESTITRRETGPAKAFRFSANMFSKALPVLQSALTLDAPPDAVKWETTPDIKALTLKGGQGWLIDRPTPFRLEPLVAPLEKVLPIVWLNDAKASWPAEAQQYLDQIKDRLEIAPAIRDAAAEATKGTAKISEKITVLARLVQRDLTYKAIEFGRRARLPASAEQTLRNRYGDCKDHALLLCQMLESVGISANLAVVSSSSHIRAELPSLDQFNHMIVYVPAGAKNGLFVDCTGKSADLSAGGPPVGLATQQALILDKEKPRLITIPDYAAGSGLKVERRIALSEQSPDLEIDESLTFTGVLAATMRGSLIQVQPSERKRMLLQTLHAQLPSIEFRDAEIGEIDEPLTALTLRVRYLLRQKSQSVGGHLLVQPPAAWERMFLAPTPLEKRLTPFRIWVPTSFESNVVIAPPAGWKPSLPEKRTLEKPYCTATLQPKLEQKDVHLTCRIDQRTGEFSAAQYGAYTEAMAAALALLEQPIIFDQR